MITLNTVTGAATVVGPIINPTSGSGIDASALAFDAAGNLFVLKTISTPELYRLDPSDASVIETIPIPGYSPGTALGGMEFDDATGKLYATLLNGSELVILNQFTGATEVMGFTAAETGLEVVSACGEKVPSVEPRGMAVLIASLFLLGAGLLRRSHQK